jgi:hypothetical protein
VVCTKLPTAEAVYSCEVVSSLGLFVVITGKRDKNPTKIIADKSMTMVAKTIFRLLLEAANQFTNVNCAKQQIIKLPKTSTFYSGKFFNELTFPINLWLVFSGLVLVNIFLIC